MKKGNNVNISEILGTKNKREQTEKAQALVNAVRAPVVDLIIRFDGRIGRVATVQAIGAQVGMEDALGILEEARRWLLAAEAQAKAQAEEPQAAPEPL